MRRKDDVVAPANQLYLQPNLSRLILSEGMSTRELMSLSTTERDIAILRACYGGQKMGINESNFSPLLIVEARLIVEGFFDLFKSAAEFLGLPTPEELLTKSLGFIKKSAPKVLSWINKKYGDFRPR